MKKSLSNLIKLESKVSIYIPSTVNVNEKTSNVKQVNSALKQFSSKFGGATSVKSVGCWVTETGKLIKEKVTVVYSYTNTDTLEKEISGIIEFAEALKIEMAQEAIALEVNGELYFV